MKLAEKYRIVHQQGFIPIFVADDFDAVVLAEACVAAGARAIEITCRRATVIDDIRRVRRQFPDLVILAGSVMDDGPLLKYLQCRRCNLPGIRTLIDLGVDGLVSMMPIALETVARYSKTHLVIPGVETLRDAVRAVEAGAHFAKFFSVAAHGGHLYAGLLTSSPTHGILPLMVTGGVTLESIDGFVAARIAVLGSGWNVILNEKRATGLKPGIKKLAQRLRLFLDAMSAARQRHVPGWTLNTKKPTADYLAALAHYHPF